MMRDPASVDVVAALRLRAAVLDLLAGRALTDVHASALTRAGSAAWSMLLRAEACALPLTALGTDWLTRHEIDADARAILQRRTREEMQRVLAARSSLRAVDAVCASLDLRATVLKGGVLAAIPAAPALDLGDVDVLVASEDRSRLWDALIASGWSPTASGLGPRDAMAQARNHLAPIRPPGVGLPLELHHRVAYDRSIDIGTTLSTAAIPGFRGLRQPVGPDAVLLVLLHCVVQHPLRRGHLRDLCLLRHLCASLDAEALGALDRRISGHEHASTLAEMLSHALALRDGAFFSDSPSTVRTVALKYALTSDADRHLAFRAVWRALAPVALESAPVRHRMLRGYVMQALHPLPPDSLFGSPPLAQNRMSGGGALVRRGARFVVRSALAATIVLGGALIRRRTHAAAGRARSAA